MAPGKKVFFARPPETDMRSMLTVKPGEETGVWNVNLEHVQKYATGWSGFTEADVMGAAIGASDEIAFDQDLWSEMVADNIEWMQKMAAAILDSVIAHLSKQEAVAKNSEPA